MQPSESVRAVAERLRQLPLSPLASVQTPLRARGDGSLRAQVAALPHIVALISDCLDFALPTIWSLPRACEANLLSILPRLAARGISDGVDPFYWRYQCSQGLVFAVTHENLEMVAWLHAYCPSVLPYAALIEAARVGSICMLEWLSSRHENAVWLPHMMDAAVSTGQLQMLQYLHDHPKSAGCTIEFVIESTIKRGDFETLQWIHARYSHRMDRLRVPMYHAISRKHTEIVTFLDQHPEQYSVDVPLAVQYAAEAGDLELLQWLYSKLSSDACSGGDFDLVDDLIDAAASGGHLHVVKWLHEHHPGGCTAAAMDSAAQQGNLELVQWLHENRTEGCTANAMGNAVSRGHLDIAKWLHENRTEGCAAWAMDETAQCGHLDAVQWLHENRTEGCTTKAMDTAARNGHLDVVKWLHENRTEGCTSKAMDEAACDGRLDVVIWLHENRTEGCTAKAIDSAACNGHLGVVEWLHENRMEGCSLNAIACAAREGHLDVVKWLHKNRTECCTHYTMDNAAARGHLDIVKWLHENRTDGCSTNAMESAARNGHFDIVLFLHEHRNEGCTHDAIAAGETCIKHMEIVQWLHDKYPGSVSVDGLRTQTSYMPAVLEHVLDLRLTRS